VEKGPQVFKWVRDLLQEKYKDTSFSSFIKMVIERLKNLCPAHKNCTFFTNHLDDHWRPYSSRCGYCSTHYTVIAKLETFDKGLKYIGRLANISFKGELGINKASEKTSQVLSSYFGQINKDLLMELKKL